MDDVTIETATNIETTILPLLSICNLTNEFKTINNNEKKPQRIKHQLLTDTIQLASEGNQQLKKLIDDCQENFEKEANILLENQMSGEHIEELFRKYKQFLTDCCINRSEFFIPSDLSNVQKSIESSCASSETFDSLTTRSHSFDMNDFDFDFASLTASANSISQLSPATLHFQHSQLFNGPDLLYSNFIQLGNDCDIPLSNTSNISAPNDDYHQEVSSDYFDKTLDSYFFESNRRKKLTKENKDILEAAFLAKNCPNTTERNYIAKKCNISSSQVRIWFRNKRSRCKGRI